MGRVYIRALLMLPALLLPEVVTSAQAEVLRGVVAEGACAIVGMSAEQSQLTALQRARAAAIEQAAGIDISASTLVTNMTLASDFIRTYSRGFIISEKVKWLPLGQYQKDQSSPPIPEYRVHISADVMVPKQAKPNLGLEVTTNRPVFRSGEKAVIEVRSDKAATIAIFNITADDKVVMLYPFDSGSSNFLAGGGRLVFPSSTSNRELEMQTLPGHKRDTEAFFVVAVGGDKPHAFTNAFIPGEPYGYSEFFARYSDLAERCQDAIVPYEVLAVPEGTSGRR